MVAKKQIQMVCPAGLVADLLKTLKQLGVQGYTLLDVRMGAGRSGESESSNLPGYSTRYLLFVCTAQQLPALLPELQQMVDEYGGLLLVSDVLHYEAGAAHS